jgi:DNA processing protein
VNVTPEVLARASLMRASEPGDPHIGEAVLLHGPVDVLDAIKVGRSPLPKAERYRSRLSGREVERDIERAVAQGIRFSWPGQAEWLPRLADLGSHAPIGLWLRGPLDLAQVCDRSVAVVGSRSATAYGQHVASEIAAGVAERRWAVVSGGAYGIDVAAHRGALAVHGATVAVLACGVDVDYPRGHNTLFNRISQEGLIVSELPPGEHPTRARFLQRNRVIAALTRGTLVVEAGFRSGALNTLAHAEQLMRPVLGVPGPVTSPMSAGVHEKVREGRALLVTDSDEVLEALSPMGEGLTHVGWGEQRMFDMLDDIDQQVFEALSVRLPREAAVVARRAGIPAVEVAARLSGLELLGRVRRTETGWLAVPE